MDLFKYIMQRMTNMGYNKETVVIESYVIDIENTAEIKRERHSEEYIYVYDVTDYTKSWKLLSDLGNIDSDEFILNQTVPSGIYELTGNVTIVTTDIGNSCTLMCYRAIPGVIKK